MRLSTALVVGALAGTLIGQTGFTLLEHSYFARGYIYRAWLRRSAVRPERRPPVKIHTPILSAVEKAAQEGLRAVARQTLKLAREKSPTDSGDSDKSGFVVVDDLTAQVGFTSLVSKLNHENLDWRHEDGGEPKFLENAALEVDVAGIMAAEARKRLS